jgi:hypothetical protein
MRSGANDDFQAGQVRRQEGLEIFLLGDAPHIKKYRALAAEETHLTGVEQVGIDPPRPRHEALEAPLAQLRLQ